MGVWISSLYHELPAPPNVIYPAQIWKCLCLQQASDCLLTKSQELFDSNQE